MSALDSKHYYNKERPTLKVIRDYKTYNLFGFGQPMTAGQIIVLFGAAATISTGAASMFKRAARIRSALATHVAIAGLISTTSKALSKAKRHHHLRRGRCLGVKIFNDADINLVCHGFKTLKPGSAQPKDIGRSVVHATDRPLKRREVSNSSIREASGYGKLYTGI